MAKWIMAACLLHAAQVVMGSSPEPPPMLADSYASMWIKKAMLTSIKSAGVIPEVNLKITQVRKHAREPSWL